MDFLDKAGPVVARIALHASDEVTRLALVKAFEGSPSDWDVFLSSEEHEYDVLVTDDVHRDGDRVIRFDPEDPQRAVLATAQAVAGSERRLTVITGARRGTGVSALALHVCAALSAGHDVCLLDLDPDSSLRARLDLPADARHWGDVADGVRAAAVPVPPGFRVLLAPPDARGDVNEVLRTATARFEHVVADAPLSPWRGAALASCTTGILVVPPAHQGIFHAGRVLARHPHVRWSCLVNRLGAGGELTAPNVARRLGRPVSLDLPCSGFLRDREDDHRLLVTRWSRYYRRVSRLAQALA